MRRISGRRRSRPSGVRPVLILVMAVLLGLPVATLSSAQPPPGGRPSAPSGQTERSVDPKLQALPAGAPKSITGRVLDRQGRPVSEASVHAARTDRFTRTDDQGRFQLTDVPSASPGVVATKEGYDFVMVPAEGSAALSITLPALRTPPRAEYPRPDADRRPFTRDAWQSLNGSWSFDFDPQGVGEKEGWFEPDHQYGKAIRVPFPYHSLAAFGEESLATDAVYRSFADGYACAVWYRRTFTVPQGFAGHRTQLRIGATNWGAAVWLDGKEVLPYRDEGDIEIPVDLGELAPGSEHTVVIKVVTPAANLTTPYPIGRRDIFGNAGGIWQSVWIEPTSAVRLENPQVVPDVVFEGSSRTPARASATVNLAATGAADGLPGTVTVRDPGGAVVGSARITLADGRATTKIDIPRPKLWDLGRPNLYTADVAVGRTPAASDGVRVTFGLRRIERKAAPGSGGDYQYVWLNNRPVYLRGVLDQGFNPWGTATPTGVVTGGDLRTGTEAEPGRGSIRYDLLSVQRRGLNLVRSHVKVFEPAYYHEADRLGLLMWHEQPNPGRGDTVNDRAQAYFEKLLKASLVRDRNHPSIVVWTLYNEGWGASGGPHPLQPKAISFIKEMAAVTRAEFPNVLLNDNSACCENGHTSVTDLNDNHGWSEFGNLADYLKGVSEDLYPGSKRNFDEGAQAGQPWLSSEFSFNSGAQLTSMGLMRGYAKHAGYAGVQLADQEYEMVSPYTYDRLDRGSMFLDHQGRLRGAELVHGDDAVSIMSGSMATVRPGQRLDLPIRVSHWSDRRLDRATLHWKVAGVDRVTGAWRDPNLTGSKPLAPKRYTVTDAGTLSVKVPEELRTGYVWVWLRQGNDTVAETLLTFDDGSPEAGAFSPLSPAKASWTGGSRIALTGGINEQIVGYGKGYFEYEAKVPAAAREGGTLIFEASSAEAATLVDGLHATSARKFPTEVEVLINGTKASSAVLPDDPWYPLGVAARAHGIIRGGDGNHYGYRIAVPLTRAMIGGRDTITVRVASSGGGLQLFGLHAGDQGAPPRIVAGSVSAPVPAPKPSVSDRPGLGLTPAVLDDQGKGVAVVSVINDTDRTVRDVVAELDLPSGWRAEPVTSAKVAALGPAKFAHVEFAIQAPPDWPAGRAASMTAGAFWTDDGQRRVIQLPGQQKPAATTAPTGPGASISGDSRSEAIMITPDGKLRTWHNLDGFSTPWGVEVVDIADGITEPGRLRLADLDGDRRTDLIKVEGDGTVRAWRNERGFAADTFAADSVVLTTGVTAPERLKFTDLDGDGRVELIMVEADGKLRAWRNERGIADHPYSASSIIVGTADPQPIRIRFADLDADRRNELIQIDENGTVRAQRNVNGYAESAWTGGLVTIGTGFRAADLAFADLDGDGKAEISANDGTILLWHNTGGFANFPWGRSIGIGSGFAVDRFLFG